jgi:hypothetical protein
MVENISMVFSKSVFFCLICQKLFDHCCCYYCDLLNTLHRDYSDKIYSGRGKFMPLPLKSKILKTPGSLATDDIKMFLL